MEAAMSDSSTRGQKVEEYTGRKLANLKSAGKWDTKQNIPW